jgi:hypothetical protein
MAVDWQPENHFLAILLRPFAAVAFGLLIWAVSYGIARVLPEGRLKSVLYCRRTVFSEPPRPWQRGIVWAILIGLAVAIVRANYWR